MLFRMDHHSVGPYLLSLMLRVLEQRLSERGHEEPVSVCLAGWLHTTHPELLAFLIAVPPCNSVKCAVAYLLPLSASPSLFLALSPLSHSLPRESLSASLSLSQQPPVFFPCSSTLIHYAVLTLSPKFFPSLFSINFLSV